MNDVIQAASELQGFFLRRNWRFCIIGGLALQRWGEPRETVDVDVTLLTGFGSEELFVQDLLTHYESRIADAGSFAMRNRVLLLRAQSGVGLDVALGALPFEEQCIARATEFPFPGDANLRVCSAEDLVVMKAFASRPRDWVDIEGILIRQSNLDWDYVVEQLKPLVELKGTPETMQDLEQRRRRIGHQ